MTDRHFQHFGPFFCPFSPLTNWKIKILTLKKTPGDTIILEICPINDNQLMCCSSDTEHDRHNFSSFWTIFCSFTPLWTQKINIFKEIFTNINDSHMTHGSSNMECNRQNFLSFWTILSSFTLLTTQKIKIWKNEKNT